MRASLVSISLLLPCLLLAQGEAVNARLTGTVVDAADAPVPDARVTLLNSATGFKREFKTGMQGGYTFLSIPPGPYQLKVEKEGFTTYVQPHVVLAVAQSSTLNPKLEVGPISQVVEVAADAPLLHTSHANIGTEVSSKQAVELPLNWRNVFNLALLSSGVNNQLEYQAFT
jgi:hypothetical protein